MQFPLPYQCSRMKPYQKNILEPLKRILLTCAIFCFCAPTQPAASLFSSPYQSPYLLGAGLHRDAAWIDRLWGTFTSSRTGTSISSQLLDHLIRAKALYLMASIRP